MGLGDDTKSFGEQVKDVFRSFMQSIIKEIQMQAIVKPLAGAISGMLFAGGGPVHLAAGGSVRHMADGGQVNALRDRVPAMLEPGEFVMRKPAVKSIGAGNLGQMNATGGSMGNVQFNIVNEGAPKEAEQQGQPRLDADKIVVDVVMRDLSDNSIIIIDLKTSTRGWNKYQKSDKYKNAQIVIYKKYYSELFNIPLEKIKVEYQIMRRKLYEDAPFPIPYMSKHIPANGKPSVNKVYNEFIGFVNEVFDDEGNFNDLPFPKVPGDKGKNCRFCEFKARGLCDGKV